LLKTIFTGERPVVFGPFQGRLAVPEIVKLPSCL